jgi:hypothetical protein
MPLQYVASIFPIALPAGGRSVDSINAVASDLIEVDGAEEAPSIARRAPRDVLAKPLPDEPLLENPPDIVHDVALSYRRACRVATAAGATGADCERAAVDAAIRRYQELEPPAPLNLHAAAAVLEMVGHVILANPGWFWHGPDA